MGFHIQRFREGCARLGVVGLDAQHFAKMRDRLLHSIAQEKIREVVVSIWIIRTCFERTAVVSLRLADLLLQLQ